MAYKYKKGDRVIYTSGNHGVGSSNPLWGGPYGNIVGTVTGINSDEKDFIISVTWDGGATNSYRKNDLQLHSEGGKMIDQAKDMAMTVHEKIKPYEKYIGLVALAAVIDHFVLGGKFRERFTKMAEGVVTKITDTMDKFIDKLALDKEEAEIEEGGEV